MAETILTHLPTVSGTKIQCGTGATTYIKAFTDTSASVTLSGNGYSLLLTATEDCYFTVAGAAADGDDFPLKADTYLMIPIAGLARLDVIQSSTGGNLHIMEIT